MARDNDHNNDEQYKEKQGWKFPGEYEYISNETEQYSIVEVLKKDVIGQNGDDKQYQWLWQIKQFLSADQTHENSK